MLLGYRYLRTQMQLFLSSSDCNSWTLLVLIKLHTAISGHSLGWEPGAQVVWCGTVILSLICCVSFGQFTCLFVPCFAYLYLPLFVLVNIYCGAYVSQDPLLRNAVMLNIKEYLYTFEKNYSHCSSKGSCIQQTFLGPYSYVSTVLGVQDTPESRILALTELPFRRCGEQVGLKTYIIV